MCVFKTDSQFDTTVSFLQQNDELFLILVLYTFVVLKMKLKRIKWLFLQKFS